MRRLLFTLGVLLLPVPAFAQVNAAPNQRLGWDQGAPDLATANTYGANVYVDAAAGVAVTGKTCTGPAAVPADGWACTAALPAMTNGAHVLTLTAFLGTNESAKSAPLSIVMVIIVTPKNLKIVKTFETWDEFAAWTRTKAGRKWRDLA